jgi:Fe-S-cluster containining protein
MMSLTVLPSMECKTNCGECCGPVLCKEHEFQAVKELAAKKGISPVKQGSTCPWYQQGTCQVYEERPFICNLFGHSPKLVCPHGFNQNILPSLEKRLAKQYGKPTRLLHEIFPDWHAVLKGATE